MGNLCANRQIKESIVKPKEDDQVYNFSKRFNTDIIPSKKLEHKLTFEIRIHGVRAKLLDSKNYYFAKIVFGSSDNSFVLPITPGPNPKFTFDKSFTFEISWDDMEKNFFEVYMYSLPLTTDLQKLDIAKDILSKNKFFAKIFIDILTIAIGPEHHDIHLFDIQKKKYSGRVNFNIQCNHVENLGIKLNNFECKFNKIMHNELSFNMKFKPQNQLEVIDTAFIEPIKPRINNKENKTEYLYVNQSKKDDNDIRLENIMVSMNELRSANLSIIVYDTKLELGEDDKDKEIFDRLPNFKPYRKMASLIPVYLTSGNSINLKNKYAQIGVVYINFYKILSQNDNMILKQSSRVFQSISPLYGDQDIKSSYKMNSFNTADHRNSITGKSSNFVDEFNKTKLLKFQVVENLIKSFDEVIFSDGTPIGKLNGVISIKPVPLIKQIMCGVHTERGLDLNSNYLTIASTDMLNSEFTLPEEVSQIKSLSESLMGKLLNFSSLSQVSQDATDNKKDVSTIMNEILNLLKKSSKESSLFYLYSNDIQIVKTQEVLLRLGIDLLRMIDNFNTEHRNIGFSILETILERGEFDLSSISIYGNESNQEKLKMKILVGELFISFLTKCLKFSLFKLSKKVADESSKNFVELFLSIAYFRIPKFRKAFLETISKDMVIENMKFLSMIEKLDETNFQEDNVNQNEEQQEIDQQDEFFKNVEFNPVVLLVDWETIFYSRLEKLMSPENLKEVYENLNSILDKNEWKERLQRRGLAFLSIIKKLDFYIQRKLVVQRNILWTHIQGFRKIIQTITYELEMRDISKYNNLLIEVMNTFINDHDIMNIFVVTILSKTNALDANSVFTSFKVIDSFFREFEQKQSISQFGYKVDYNLLRKAFDAIIETDQSLSLAKLIWLYYRNSHLMSIEHMSDIFNSIFEKHFFKLFFHWSYHVRNTFYHLLFFIIQYRLKNKSFEEEKKHLTKERIEKLKNREFQGVANTLNFFYPEQLKAKILENYYEKMRIAEKIKGIIKKEKAEQKQKVPFQTNDPEINKYITDDLKNVLNISIQHFEFIEKYFKAWEKDNKGNKEPKFPDINLQPPKDDYVEYNDSW